MSWHPSKGPGQGPARGPEPRGPRTMLDTSPEKQAERGRMAAAKRRERRMTLNDRAAQIVEAEGIGSFAALIRASKEAMGVADATRPMNKAEVRDLAIDGSAVPFVVLGQIAADERSSPDTRVAAADKYLANATKLAGADEDNGRGKIDIVVRGGLPD